MVARGWGSGTEAKLELPYPLVYGAVENRPLGTLCSDLVAKIPFRGCGPISALVDIGDVLRDPGLILALRVSLHQDDP